MNKRSIKTLFICSTVSILLLSGCTTPELSERYDYGGEKDPLSILRGNYTTVILEFQANRGSVGLYRNESITNHSAPTMTLVHVENIVAIREGSGATFEDALEVAYSEVSSQILKVSFVDSSTEYLADYEYSLNIFVSRDIIIDVNISIVNFGEINIDFLTPGMIATGLNIYTARGTINGGIGSGLCIDPTPTIKTGEGGIDLTIQAEYNRSVTWDISTANHGPIDLTIIDDSSIHFVNLNHRYNIASYKDDIRIISTLHPDYGIQINTSFSSDEGDGEITIPGGGTTFVSENFFTASIRYYFIITAWNADITFVR